MFQVAVLASILAATNSAAKPHASPAPKGAVCDSAADVTEVVVDPSETIDVSAPRSFILALRTVADGGYKWRLRPDPANAGEFAVSTGFSVPDVLFTHVDDPSSPPMVGGRSTSYFGVRVLGKTAATKTLTFDEVGPRPGATPTRTRTFNVAIKANPSAC
jgi:hypothetical protein